MLYIYIYIVFFKSGGSFEPPEVYVQPPLGMYREEKTFVLGATPNFVLSPNLCIESQPL